jgi:hypothetical protein
MPPGGSRPNTGGARRGTGPKKRLKSEIVIALRERISDQDFDDALDVFRYAMKRKRKHLSLALSAATFIVDQKIGRAPQALKSEEPTSQKVLQVSFDSD